MSDAVQVILDSLDLPEDRLLHAAVRGGFARLEAELRKTGVQAVQVGFDNAGDLVAAGGGPGTGQKRLWVLVVQKFYMQNRPQVAADLLKATELLAAEIMSSTTGAGPAR